MYEIEWKESDTFTAAEGYFVEMHVFKDGEVVEVIDHIFEDCDEDKLRELAKKKLDEINAMNERVAKKPEVQQVVYKPASEQQKKVRNILNTKIS